MKNQIEHQNFEAKDLEDTNYYNIHSQKNYNKK